jgi:hypothetical protein
MTRSFHVRRHFQQRPVGLCLACFMGNDYYYKRFVNATRSTNANKAPPASNRQ